MSVRTRAHSMRVDLADWFVDQTAQGPPGKAGSSGEYGDDGEPGEVRCGWSDCFGKFQHAISACLTEEGGNMW